MSRIAWTTLLVLLLRTMHASALLSVSPARCRHQRSSVDVRASMQVLVHSGFSANRRKRQSARQAVVRSMPNDDESEQTTTDVAAILSSEKWPSIKESLNNLPVFATVTDKGVPIAEVDGRPSSFWCDAVDAQRACVRAKEDADLRTLPFPMGDILEQAMLERANLLASEASLVDAGAEPGTVADHQPVPLFGCMQIMQEDEDGDSLPLFLVRSEAEDAVRRVIEESGVSAEEAAEFQVVGISLVDAVELLATDPEAPPFRFIPPASSVEFIKQIKLKT